LPHGTGSTARVLVVAKGEKEREARARRVRTSSAARKLSKKIQEENWARLSTRVIANAQT